MAAITATKMQARSKRLGKGRAPPGKGPAAKSNTAGPPRPSSATSVQKKNGKGTSKLLSAATKPKKATAAKSALPKAALRQAPTIGNAAKNAKLTASEKSARATTTKGLSKPNGKPNGAGTVHRNGGNGRDVKQMDTLDKPNQKAVMNGKTATRNGNGDSNTAAKQSAIVLPPTYKPSEGEPFMSEKHRMYFRMKLLKWKEDIVKQNMETLRGLHDDSPQQADPADRATAETDRALELRARDRQRKLMGKIVSALARIEEGSYGYCEETGEPISLKRLDARPIATLSLEAQERRERRERIFRED